MKSIEVIDREDGRIKQKGSPVQVASRTHLVLVGYGQSNARRRKHTTRVEKLKSILGGGTSLVA